MASKEPILDLLRTNSVSNYLYRGARNEYVGHHRTLLNELGFGQELNWDRLGDDNYYGQETIQATRSFASRNRLTGDGAVVTPTLAVKAIQLHTALEGMKMLQTALERNQVGIAFQPVDPNNLGTQHLDKMLNAINIYEDTTIKALRVFGKQQGLRDASGYEMTDALGRALLNELKPQYGAALFLSTQNPGNNNNPGPISPTPIAPVTPLPTKQLEVINNPTTVIVSDGALQVQFRKHTPQGVSTFGYQTVANHIDTNQEVLSDLSLTPSGIKVMEAVSRNEGRLDGINTYDRGFVSLGIFQWTLGSGDGEGELAALLKKYKDNYPSNFRKYFQDFGIDIAEEYTNTTYGLLTLDGQLITQAQQKDQLRSPEWAFRFWRAAQDPRLQGIEIMHGIGRLKNFYWKENYAAYNYTLNEIITSTYGVALLLDNHVNRPAWVGKCVQEAMRRVGFSKAPVLWSEQEELRVINEYLNVRSTYSENGYSPMTKANERAIAIQAELRNGNLSTARGTFEIDQFALRSYSDGFAGRDNPATAVEPPLGYVPEEYPDIKMDLD